MKKILYTFLFLFISFISKAQVWSELASSTDTLSANAQIRGICSDLFGNIYTDGWFTNGSGNHYVAKWDWQHWTELGGLNGLSANGHIYGVCSDVTTGNVYTGGWFTNATGREYVAQYNGTTWSELGGLNSLGANSVVYHVAMGVGGIVYATGDYTNTAGNHLVSVFNGTTWSEVGGFNTLAANDVIAGLHVDASGNVYCGGIFVNSFNNAYVAKWNGTVWSELGGVNALAANNGVTTICSDPSGNIYAAGSFTNGATLALGHQYVAKWDGTSWSEVGGFDALSANGGINSICSDAAGNIYAAGNFTNGSGNSYVAKYDGTSWSEVGGVNGLAANALINIIYIDNAGNLYAGGNFRNSNNKYYVARFGNVCAPNAATISQSICNNQSYLFNGNNLTTAGNYNDTLINHGGCDSILTLNLTVKATSTGAFTHAIISGNSYLFNGQQLTSAGNYNDTLTNYLGCDSVVTLTLTVSPNGINELGIRNDGLEIYPNPVGNELSVIGYSLIGNTIHIYDVLGRECISPSPLEKAGVRSSNNIELNVSKLIAGVYFVKVSDSKGNIRTARFLKE